MWPSASSPSTAPVGTALVAAVLGAVLIELVRARGRTSGDVALAVLFYGGIAGGVVLLSLAPQRPGDQPGRLPLRRHHHDQRTGDVAVFAVIAVVVLAVVGLLGQRLYAVSDDEEYARAVGLPVLALNVVLAALVAATVVLSMRVVGPAAHQRADDRARARSPSCSPAASARPCSWPAPSGWWSACSGTAASYYTGTPSGGTIVLLAIALFLVRLRRGGAARDATARRRHRRRADVHAAHPHEHGDGCGHPPVPHGDHVDYDHDGHLHAPHRTGTGVHYDEHGERTAPAGPAPKSTRHERPGLPSATAGVPGSAAPLLALLEELDGFRTAQDLHVLLPDPGRRGRAGDGLPRRCRPWSRTAQVDVLRSDDGEAAYRRCSTAHHHHLVCRVVRPAVEIGRPAGRAVGRAGSPPSTGSPTSSTRSRSSAPAPPARAGPDLSGRAAPAARSSGRPR